MRNKFLIILLSFFLFSNSFAENISIVAKNISFDKDKNIPICCFDQNKNGVFIYYDNKWEICSFEKFKDIIDTLNMRILRLITQHRLNGSGDYCNIVKQLMSNKIDYNSIKKKIYQHLKTNVTNIVEYEFV